MQATGALSWRRADIKYRKNEAFVDVIEDVNLLMSATGTVLRADVNGQIIMRAYLSGTPECKFGLNDRLTLGEDHLQQPSGNKAGAKATRAAAGSVTLEDCQFHQCVKLGKFDADRIISFVPPDGEFELMRYRATENVNLPFKVHAIVNEVGKTKVEYSIAIRANYGSKLFATNVVVRIPTPLNTARITERTSQGKAKYEPEHNNIVWKIPRFTGQSEFVLSAEASLTSMTNQKAWSRPPLSLSFSLLMFTSSGLLVRYLKVFEKSNYSSVKWVRYMTRAGNYEIRYASPAPDLSHIHLTHMFQVLSIVILYISLDLHMYFCIAGVMEPLKISLNTMKAPRRPSSIVPSYCRKLRLTSGSPSSFLPFLYYHFTDWLRVPKARSAFLRLVWEK
jgi:AP-2 complex subunit mu-1